MRLPQLSSDLAFFEKEIKNKLRFKHAIKSSVIASNGGNMGSDIASNSEPWSMLMDRQTPALKIIKSIPKANATLTVAQAFKIRAFTIAKLEQT